MIKNPKIWIYVQGFQIPLNLFWKRIPQIEYICCEEHSLKYFLHWQVFSPVHGVQHETTKQSETCSLSSALFRSIVISRIPLLLATPRYFLPLEGVDFGRCLGRDALGPFFSCQAFRLGSLFEVLTSVIKFSTGPSTCSRFRALAAAKGFLPPVDIAYKWLKF